MCRMYREGRDDAIKIFDAIGLAVARSQRPNGGFAARTGDQVVSAARQCHRFTGDVGVEPL